ncbi:hypothetical protein [Parasitella parasitica]|uniref:Uncharacterized protein n=1 Tax=Parasitella parasitica TaxID=35722 RepID=A0A0B7NI71_9FUNG|nr:hypothetical protein [Parasitella parasitica]
MTDQIQSLDDNNSASPVYVPLDLDQSYTLGYQCHNSSNSEHAPETDDNQEQDDMQEVLNALLDFESLKYIDSERFETDYITILKAISLNNNLQEKIQDQIRLVDEKLETNAKLLKEANLLTLEENRIGNKFPIHTLYRDPINYFEDAELLNITVGATENENPSGQKHVEYKYTDDDDEEEEDSEDEEEEVESVLSSTNNDKQPSHKSWSRTERERLEEGIISEAKRMISFDFVQKKEEWRVWEVDKMEKKDLLTFPVLTRSPVECLIQWTTQEHPTINKKPWSKQESQKLSLLVNEIGLFSGQWERIANELGTNRTISQCFSHYMFEKNNAHARSLKWSKEEDKRLTDAVKLFGNCNWQQVADILGERTGQQCLHRWQKSLNPVIKRQRWNTEEDALLKRAVYLYGAGNWTKIQRLIPGRTDMQCRERWVNILQPSVNRDKFTQEETDRLVELVKQHGTKWSLLQTLMPGRTDNALMRHYKATLKAAEQKKKMQNPKQPKKKQVSKRPRAKSKEYEEDQEIVSKRIKIDEKISRRRSTRIRSTPARYFIDKEDHEEE